MNDDAEKIAQEEEEENSLKGDRKFVVALARGLEVLRSFRPRDGFLGNQEIAERTGLPKPTVTRITYTLCRLGYLTRVPRLGKYQLAPSAITLGYSALANLGIRQIARPFMDEMAERLAAPVAMGIRDRVRALYVDISRGSSAFTFQLDIGSGIPLAQSAMGRALLSVMSQAEREATIERLSSRYGDDWPGVEAEMRGEIETCMTLGYAVSVGAWRPGIHAVAAPLVAADGSGIYAFNCGGPPYQFTEQFIHEQVGPALLELTRSLASVLNGTRR
ncbi:helix-turn-helix domain-containing protein [Aliihoeflea aestuarii]|uniref:IclR family transcriptional regulator n=1 Tax=Aliihoeflea aestuarii TaxID=453840 RepID=UPI0020922AB6|nr:IclR family transcriptional regulator [Aliihoeflea aestuarii]MCO6389627.1 helix-turn-helix domain-containing protein [Aliihoeflea aestuarii]